MNSSSTERNIFSFVYGVLSVFGAFIMLVLLLSGDPFGSFKSNLLFIIAAVTFVIASIAAWSYWNSNPHYNYDAPYKISKVTKISKAVFGSYAVSIGLTIIACVGIVIIFGERSVIFLDAFFPGFTLASTALLYPVVARHIK